MTARAGIALRNNARGESRGAKRIRIVGCGQWHRTDDQFGLLVARELMARHPSAIDVRYSESPGTDLLELVDDVDLLVLIDAANAGEGLPIGALKRVHVARNEIGDVADASCRIDERVASAHSLGVGFALALAESLGILPREVWVYVVGAADFGFGELLSPAVAAQIAPTIRRIEKDIQHARDRSAADA